MSNVRRGVLLGLSAYAAFSFSDAFIKLLEGGVPTFQLMFMGAALGLLALPLVKQPHERWSYLVKPRAPGIWWLRMLAGAVNNLGALLAFTHLPMAEAFALIFLMPIFVTLLSVLVLGEHVGWRRWLAVVAGSPACWSCCARASASCTSATSAGSSAGWPAPAGWC